jgi:hypothetical protein
MSSKFKINPLLFSALASQRSEAQKRAMPKESEHDRGGEPSKEQQQ